MIYSSLDSSHRDESNDSKIIPIGAIFVKIAIFAKFQVGLGRVPGSQVKIRSSKKKYQLWKKLHLKGSIYVKFVGNWVIMLEIRRSVANNVGDVLMSKCT